MPMMSVYAGNKTELIVEKDAEVMGFRKDVVSHSRHRREKSP